MEEIRKIMAELGYADGEVWRPVLHLLEEEPDELEEIEDLNDLDDLNNLDDFEDDDEDLDQIEKETPEVYDWSRLPYGRKLIDGFFFGAHV